MAAIKLTDAEARRLLEMTKQALIAELQIPAKGKTNEFDVIGDTKKDVFSVNVFRGSIQPRKYNIGARIKKNGRMLLELHINPTNVHPNPDGTVIRGSHWHIYTEEHGMRMAFPADDIQSDDFVENTIVFLNRFNVIKQPEFIFQEEL